MTNADGREPKSTQCETLNRLRAPPANKEMACCFGYAQIARVLPKPLSLTLRSRAPLHDRCLPSHEVDRLRCVHTEG